MVKVFTPPSAGGYPFSDTQHACDVCGAVTFYVHLDGRALCPRHKP